MTLQTLSPPLFATTTGEVRVGSFWRRLLDSIIAERQRKANEYVADYLRTDWRGYSAELRSVRERRPLQR
jgi:hypothetical protein